MLEYVEFISSSSENEDESEESSKGEIDGDDDMDDIDQKVIMKIQRKKSVEKKKEIISLILRFKTRISIIEKEKKSQLYSKSNQQDFSCLEEEEEKMNIDRKNEKQSLKESLKKISLKVETLKKEKASKQKSAAFVERLRVCIEDIELNIMQLKQKQSKIYEELSLNEQKLTSIVSGFEKKFNQWSEKVNKIPKVNSSEEKEDIQLPAEVKDFEDFIKLTGGHQGGWDDFDHNIFLKLRKQFKKDDQLIKIAESEIVTQNRDDIIQHIQWYHEYSKLKERKKQAIFAWKTMKQNNRETALANINDEPFEEDIKRIRREKLFKKEREDRFAGLEQWKKEKANQKLEEETSQKKHNFILNKDKEDQRKVN